MNKYVILQRRGFESNDKFARRINEQFQKGYRAINMSNGGFVLMEKMT